MSRHHDQLVRLLCHNDATFKKAKAILHTASLKTTPGSGYDLGQVRAGCQLYARTLRQKRDDEVDEKTAQVASCLKPKVFKTTLNTVRSALAAAAAATSPTKKSLRNVSYKQLVDDAKIGRKGMVTGWMNDAERALMNNREMRRRFGSAYDAITLAVFCWNKKVKPPTLVDKYATPRDQFDELMDALHEVCKGVAKNIQEDIAAIKAGTYAPKAPPAAALSASPTKGSTATLPPPIPAPSRAVSRSPSKSALRAPSVGLTPTKTPTHKRKVAFDGPIPEEDEEEEEFDVNATPSKRRKLSTPVKPFPSGTPRASSRLADVAAAREAALPPVFVPAAGPSTPRRQRTTPSQPSSTPRSVRSRSQAGSAPTTPSRRPRLSTVREEVDGPPRRRCRPVFADQQQWLKGDSRLERELQPWQDKWQELVRRAGGDVWKAAAATVRVAA
ncbi:hypothetical protein LXA43DRAFT_1092922 [Ganoderma leucocontextum]|nr:hypothetical protein LXA43DRAFT_1092922 [Ganoderma leucocontextum]